MWQQIVNWYKRPFNSDMDAKSWGLFTGLILVLIIFWNMILREAGIKK